MIARFAESIGQSFEAYVSYGIAVIFSLQIIINIGVSTGLLSNERIDVTIFKLYGSSLLVCSIFTGIIYEFIKSCLYLKRV